MRVEKPPPLIIVESCTRAYWYSQRYAEAVAKCNHFEGLLDRISEEIRYLRASKWQDLEDCDEVLYNILDILKERTR